jgi:glycosyltransferase involved in cell wall biosynthesis
MKPSKLITFFLSKSGSQYLAIALYKKLLKFKKIINGSVNRDLVVWKLKSQKQTIFVDVSSLVAMDHGGGIQRVQRSLIDNWSIYPPVEFDVFPIYYSESDMKFHFVGPGQVSSLQFYSPVRRGIVEMASGDIYLNTDLNYRFAIENDDFYHSLQKHKISAYTVVYDLLPITMPDSFPAGIQAYHQKWLELAMLHTTLICISKTVELEAIKWGATRGILAKTNSINLGSDLVKMSSSTQVTEKKHSSQSELNFLIVSTIEVRKCHELVLSAFEILWEQGVDAKLTFVGRKGWKVEDFLERIESHRHLNEKLFWFKNIGDEDLSIIYKDSTALINASLGEGFGLPLVEASFYGLPLILRDIPIFREIAGEKSWYFSTEKPNELALSLVSWIKEFSKGDIGQNSDIKVISWQESSIQIINIFRHHESNRGKVR